jgi:hypothetical protein
MARSLTVNVKSLADFRFVSRLFLEEEDDVRRNEARPLTRGVSMTPRDIATATREIAECKDHRLCKVTHRGIKHSKLCYLISGADVGGFVVLSLK